MTETGWQRTWVRALTTVLTLCVMAMIFAFSTEDADRSDQTSGIISRAVIRVFFPHYEASTAEERQRIYDEVQHVVRKCAHFSEYTLLGFMLRLCLESWFGRRRTNRYALMLPALGAGAVYAGSDEWHQQSVDGRSGQWTDVLIDSCGVLFGAFLGTRVILAIERKKQARNAKA